MEETQTKIKILKEEYERLVNQVDSALANAGTHKNDEERIKALKEKLTGLAKPIITSAPKTMVNRLIIQVQSIIRSINTAPQSKKTVNTNDLIQIKEQILPQAAMAVLDVERLDTYSFTTECLIESINTTLSDMTEEEKGIRLTQIKDSLDAKTLDTKEETTVAKLTKGIDASRSKYPSAEQDTITDVVERSTYHTVGTSISNMIDKLALTSDSITIEHGTSLDQLEILIDELQTIVNKQPLNVEEVSSKLTEAKQAAEGLNQKKEINPNHSVYRFGPLIMEDVNDSLNHQAAYKMKCITNSMIDLIEAHNRGAISDEEFKLYMDGFHGLATELMTTLSNSYDYVTEMAFSIRGFADNATKDIKGPKV